MNNESNNLFVKYKNFDHIKINRDIINVCEAIENYNLDKTESSDKTNSSDKTESSNKTESSDEKEFKIGDINNVNDISSFNIVFNHIGLVVKSKEWTEIDKKKYLEQREKKIIVKINDELEKVKTKGELEKVKKIKTDDKKEKAKKSVYIPIDNNAFENWRRVYGSFYITKYGKFEEQKIKNNFKNLINSNDQSGSKGDSKPSVSDERNSLKRGRYDDIPNMYRYQIFRFEKKFLNNYFYDKYPSLFHNFRKLISRGMKKLTIKDKIKILYDLIDSYSKKKEGKSDSVDVSEAIKGKTKQSEARPETKKEGKGDSGDISEAGTETKEKEPNLEKIETDFQSLLLKYENKKRKTNKLLDAMNILNYGATIKKRLIKGKGVISLGLFSYFDDCSLIDKYYSHPIINKIINEEPEIIFNNLFNKFEGLKDLFDKINRIGETGNIINLSEFEPDVLIIVYLFNEYIGFNDAFHKYIIKKDDIKYINIYRNVCSLHQQAILVADYLNARPTLDFLIERFNRYYISPKRRYIKDQATEIQEIIFGK
jgi:hypothetical protein